MNETLLERFGRFTVDSPSRQPEHINYQIASASRQSNRVREYVQKQRQAADAKSWLSRPELPSTNEVMDIPEGWEMTDPDDGTIILEPNKAFGPWDDKEHYLSTHYELLREEAVRPLREAVAFIRASPEATEAINNGKGIGIYDKVHITGHTYSKRGLGIKVVFSLSRVGKNIKWNQSKRLITGSIVALSPRDDMFRTKCIVAVVAARPLIQLEQNPPCIDLFFARPDDLEVDTNIEYVMVEERSGFFEAQRHTMTALQKMMREM
jgi:helicase required for RNAi-mediated heterochromatin assembly 1